VRREQFGPTSAGLGAALADAGGEMLAHAIGNEELGVFRPTIIAFGEADFVLAQGLAVRRGGILLVRRAIADVAVEDDEGRAALRLPKHIERVPIPLDVVGAPHAQTFPAVTEEPGGDIFAKGDACVAFDRDMVVVVNPAEIIEGEMAGKRCRFRTDALHHAAVTAYRINIVA